MKESGTFSYFNALANTYYILVCEPKKSFHESDTKYHLILFECMDKQTLTIFFFQ